MLCLNKNDMATNDNHGLGILLPEGSWEYTNSIKKKIHNAD